jgi:hypothetical protein
VNDAAKALVRALVGLVTTSSREAVSKAVRAAYTQEWEDKDRGPFPNADVLLSEVMEQAEEESEGA